MDNPIFKVGMLFADVKECRNALASYSIRNRVKVNKIKNEPGRLEAVCSEGCPWWLKASSDSRSGGFIIRAYVGEHTSEAKWELKARRSYNTGRGSAHYLLLGDGRQDASQPIPDLNAPADEEEVQITQNAPVDEV
jgi:hypothetical protein